MSSKFERDMRRQMEKNTRDKTAEYPCPYCGQEFHYPLQAVVFGGDVTCSHCGQTFVAQSDAGNQVVSMVEDFRKNLQRDLKRINRRNRRRR